MRYCQNKKSAVSDFLVMVLIVTAGFVVIFMVIPIILKGADTAQADSLCKGSVALREKTYTEIKAPLPVVPDPKITSVSTPLLCETSSFDLPEDKNADREDIKKEFADLVASCWNRYGEGLINDVFRGEGSRAKNNCQVCYTVNLRETSEFKKFPTPNTQNIIPADEFRQYLFATPYKVTPEDDGCRGIDGGFCINLDNIDNCANKLGIDKSYSLIDDKSSICSKKGQAACCYTDYGCWNKGGRCSASNPNPDAYNQYDDAPWNCPEDLKCFVKKENHYTYGEYVQSFGGEGLIMVLTNIVPGETYAVSFGSPTDSCGGWCNTFKTAAAIAGGVAGAAAVVVGVAGAPFTLGASLTVTVIGIGAIAGAAGGALVGKELTEGIEHLKDVFRDRGISTVYFMSLNQLHADGEELCKLVESV